MVNPGPGLGELVVVHKKGGIVFGYDFSCLGVTTQVISKNERGYYDGFLVWPFGIYLDCYFSFDFSFYYLSSFEPYFSFGVILD